MGSYTTENGSSNAGAISSPCAKGETQVGKSEADTDRSKQSLSADLRSPFQRISNYKSGSLLSYYKAKADLKQTLTCHPTRALLAQGLTLFKPCYIAAFLKIVFIA